MPRTLSAPSFTPFYWREAVLAVPGIPLLLVLGIMMGQPVHGAIAAGSAFSVGFGAARGLRGQRWGGMLGAIFVMTIATLIGSLTGNVLPVYIAITALAAALCARLALLNEDAWWVVLQGAIALFVSGYYAGTPQEAMIRTMTVLAGGSLQMALVMILTLVVPGAYKRVMPRMTLTEPTQQLLRAHMLRAIVSVLLCTLVAQALGLANSYWAPMTTLIVLKPGLNETVTRGWYRLAGTMGGCLAAGIYAALVDSGAIALVLGVVVTSGLAYGLQKAHYAVFTMALTASVVLFVSLGNGTAFTNAEHRLLASCLGGIMALVVARIAPHRPAPMHPTEDRIGE